MKSKFFAQDYPIYNLRNHAGISKAMQLAGIKGIDATAGKCFGFKTMLMQACFLKELGGFMTRLKCSTHIPVDVIQAKEKSIDQQIFLQNVAISQIPQNYVCLFAENTSVNYQNASASLNLVGAQALKDKGGIANFLSVSGIYDHKSLIEQLEKLEKILSASTDPVCIDLTGKQHSSFLTYDNDDWIYIDINNEFNTVITKNISTLATEVLSAHKHKNKTGFKIELYCLGIHKHQFEVVATNTEFENSHKNYMPVNESTVWQKGDNGDLWIELASQIDHPELCKTIVDQMDSHPAKYANQKVAWACSHSARHGFLEQVKLISSMHSYTVNVSQCVTLAAQNGHISIMRYFLENNYSSMKRSEFVQAQEKAFKCHHNRAALFLLLAEQLSGALEFSHNGVERVNKAIQHLKQVQLKRRNTNTSSILYWFRPKKGILEHVNLIELQSALSKLQQSNAFDVLETLAYDYYPLQKNNDATIAKSLTVRVASPQ